jgi:hypothetical protein
LDSLFVKTNVFLPTLILSLFLSLIFSLPSICLPFIENGLPFDQKIKNKTKILTKIKYFFELN